MSESQFTRVTERMPEKRCYCFVYDENILGSQRESSYHPETQKFTVFDNMLKDYREIEVTHWHELPKPIYKYGFSGQLIKEAV